MRLLSILTLLLVALSMSGCYQQQIRDVVRADVPVHDDFVVLDARLDDGTLVTFIPAGKLQTIDSARSVLVGRSMVSERTIIPYDEVVEMRIRQERVSVGAAALITAPVFIGVAFFYALGQMR